MTNPSSPMGLYYLMNRGLIRLRRMCHSMYKMQSNIGWYGMINSILYHPINQTYPKFMLYIRLHCLHETKLKCSCVAKSANKSTCIYIRKKFKFLTVGTSELNWKAWTKFVKLLCLYSRAPWVCSVVCLQVQSW